MAPKAADEPIVAAGASSFPIIGMGASAGGLEAFEQFFRNLSSESGMLPVCSYCKKIRDDKGYWNQLEAYITEHSDALFSHGMCPACAEKAFKELDEWKKKNTEAEGQEPE